MSAAGFAVQGNASILDVDLGLGVFAVPAENELVDEAVQIVLELGSFMRAVDDPPIVGRIGVGLRPEFETKVFDDGCMAGCRDAVRP